MANTPPQPPPFPPGGSPVSFTPPQHNEKNPMATPLSSPVPPRFPPPRLQQGQIASPSMAPPNLQSPANGVKAGSPISHLSTPPGPPAFTSPVRPAAVPFQTSPATPQPVAFPSGSSLPTSSSPQLMNSAAEVQHQVSDATADSMLLQDTPVLFSAHKVNFTLSHLMELKTMLVFVPFVIFVMFYFIGNAEFIYFS